MGNFIPEGKIQPDIKAMLDSWGIARNRYEYNPDLVPQRMQCTYTNNFSCFGYVDRNSNLVILPVWISDFTGCGDWFARSSYFYNDRAVAYFPRGKEPLIDGFFLFINTKGEPINNVGYDYVESFYRKLTMVMFKDGERAYINTSGNVVWSEKLQKTVINKRFPT